ncbi:hypothetical protein ANANG_G00065150 [Anguilla anguilla]|uniref:Uncharacterized protein n=1 Tax=Anguilla anguilla TaxID=7936 RepID=A0A9D3MPG2_ANGAN|nr:hypothetical protein ANANG_G00065150 [Anguilla anguilla]
MDIVSKLNIEAKIRKDCGILHSCVEYIATTVLCWSKSKYEEQVWEVNMRLKLQDICRDVGMSPSSSEAPLMSAQDTQRAALADL